MEAMVNSDNVVRGGLTPKFKDKTTLVQMLKYEFKERKQNSGETLQDSNDNKVVQYKTGYAEFMVTHAQLKGTEAVEMSFNSVAIALVLEGAATAEMQGLETVQMEGKTAYFIMPGQKFKIQKAGDQEKASIFVCSCDI